MAVTKQKGSIAEAKVLAYLIEKGFNVFIPWGEDHRFDLVCEYNGIFKRIQVKYVSAKNNGIEIPLRSMNNWSELRYSPANVDVLAAYNPQTDKIYFVNLQEYENTATIKLRFNLPRNSQKKYIKNAADFQELKLPT